MVAALALATLLAARHPIHSSAASLTLSSDRRSVAIVMRVFADDFPAGRAPDAVERYLASRFHLYDATGKPLGVKVEQVSAEGPVLLLRLRAGLPHGLAGIRVWHGVLAEHFTDQVNIVQARYDGRTVSLLFTASDGPKPLP